MLDAVALVAPVGVGCLFAGFGRRWFGAGLVGAFEHHFGDGAEVFLESASVLGLRRGAVASGVDGQGG
ncbi:hypothetical protein ACWEOZ_42050 [Actinoplanes sp. NPDC004185]